MAHQSLALGGKRPGLLRYGSSTKKIWKALSMPMRFFQVLEHRKLVKYHGMLFTVAITECLVRLGRHSDAKAACLQSWANHQYPDIALSMANVVAANAANSEPGELDALRLSWIDKSFDSRVPTSIEKNRRETRTQHRQHPRRCSAAGRTGTVCKYHYACL